jgi:hypothetical protein
MYILFNSSDDIYHGGIYGTSVSTVTRILTGGLTFDSHRRKGIFLFAFASRLALGYIQREQGAISPGIKRPRRGADHSPLSSEVKNAWKYTSTPLYVITTWCLVEQRDKFTFAFTFKFAYQNDHNRYKIQKIPP